ncbi:MAG: signal peptidase I [Candidatus Methanospirareceae archaeon]
MKTKIIPLALILLLVAISIGSISDYQIAIVASDSMEPALKIGDIAFIHEEDPETIKEGDIVAFHVPLKYQNEYNYPPRVIHRVTEIKEIRGVTYIETKGDNSDKEDIFRTPLQNVVGVYSGFKIPFLGLLILFLRTPPGITYAGIVVLTLIFLEYVSYQTRREKERSKKIYKQSNQLHECVHELTAAISDYAHHLKTHTAVLQNLNSTTHKLNEATKELALLSSKKKD